MMPKSTSYHEKLIQDLKEHDEAAVYIEAALEEKNPEILGKALKNVIEAQGGIEKLSSEVKLSYEKFNQILIEKEEVEFYSLYTLLYALGLQLAVTVKSA